jgi:hypothetical protein
MKIAGAIIALALCAAGLPAAAEETTGFCAEAMKQYEHVRENAFRWQAVIESSRPPRSSGSVDYELTRLAELAGLSITVQLMIAQHCPLPDHPMEINPNPLGAFRCGQAMSRAGMDKKYEAEEKKVCGF